MFKCRINDYGNFGVLRIDTDLMVSTTFMNGHNETVIHLPPAGEERTRILDAIRTALENA